ncbi:hypothetical protein O6H91_06G089700 [Diphasiastrum complanatum]|uniref:Uncharacterized protein n=1 Tax=Diphasiastrum complanatum TaxID=34168 RepID=A0ACC2DG66_DIPCM|nr:hypothetical protein O6H91_06G089700 [Diphasiastrum complanatum]
MTICPKNQIYKANSYAYNSNFNQITACAINKCGENASHSDDKPTNVSSETVGSLIVFGAATSMSHCFSSLFAFKEKSVDAVDEGYKLVQEDTTETLRKNLPADLDVLGSHEAEISMREKNPASNYASQKPARTNESRSLSCRHSNPTAKDVANRNSTICRKLFNSPCQEDIENFFAASEQQQQKQLSARYNFDFVNGVPLQGRYEWVSLQRT